MATVNTNLDLNLKDSNLLAPAHAFQIHRRHVEVGPQLRKTLLSHWLTLVSQQDLGLVRLDRASASDSAFRLLAQLCLQTLHPCSIVKPRILRD